jgi:hypothetical protein
MRRCLVVLTLLFSCINTSFALDGLGTASSPWLIQSLADFDQFTGNSTYWAGYTRLDIDINLTGRTYTAAPIAPGGGTTFTGTFNGNSHSVSSLTIDGTYCLGLFGRINNGSVTNLGMENVNISGTDYYIGGFCGYNSYGTITNCYSIGSVAGNESVGGLCGGNYNGNITNCYSTGSVTGSGDSSYCIGGLCGGNYKGNITNCYSTGPATGSGYSSDYTGGLCGYNSGTITRCYAADAVTGNNYTGGFCGYNDGTITDCYWDIDASGQTTSSGGWGLTSVQMKQAASYPGWNNGNWTINEGIDTPRLSWQNCPGSVITTDWPTPTYAGSGTETQPYLIANADDLLCLSRRTPDWSSYFILTADIDLNGLSFSTAMIAYGSSFTGIFNGNDHVIKNLTIMVNNHVGLFYHLGHGSYVTDLALEDCDIQGNDYVGGLCGENYYGTITSCYSTGSVTGSGDYVGGLCGVNWNGNITNCYSTGSVTGSGDSSYCIGGLCGGNGGTITNCYSTGSVAGSGIYSYYIGGLCGGNGGTITSCYSTSSVTGSGDYVGGLCGENYGHITNCYSTGLVAGSDYVGGLLGYLYSGTVTGCFWDTQTSGTTDGVGNVNPDPTGVSGKITSQMQDINTFLTANWDFLGVWWINQGRDYPKFRFQPFGDLNNDCHVNMYDFAILAAAWLTSPGDANYNSVAELTGDDIIDTADLAALARRWLMGRKLPKPGDFNKNYSVDLIDFAIFSQAWLTSSGQPDYNEDCDLVDDDTINIADLAIFAENFLQGL